MPFSGAVAPLEPPMTMMSRLSTVTRYPLKPGAECTSGCLPKESLGDRFGGDRLFAMFDYGVAVRNRQPVIAGSKDERHAAFDQFVGDRIDHLPVQVYVEDGGVDVRIVMDECEASSASRWADHLSPARLKITDHVIDDEILVLDQEHASANEGFRSIWHRKLPQPHRTKPLGVRKVQNRA